MEKITPKEMQELKEQHEQFKKTFELNQNAEKKKLIDNLEQKMLSQKEQCLESLKQNYIRYGHFNDYIPHCFGFIDVPNSVKIKEDDLSSLNKKYPGVIFSNYFKLKKYEDIPRGFQERAYNFKITSKAYFN